MSVSNGVCPVPRAFLAVCDSKLHPWRAHVTIADMKRGGTRKLVVRSHATELIADANSDKQPARHGIMLSKVVCVKNKLTPSKDDNAVSTFQQNLMV